MADDKLKPSVRSDSTKEKPLFLLSAILCFVITSAVVFLAFTIHQLHQIRDVERMLEDKRLRIQTLRSTCRTNDYVRKVCSCLKYHKRWDSFVKPLLLRVSSF